LCWQAVEHYQGCLTIDAMHDAAHYNLGSCFLLMGQTDEAIHHFKCAIEIKRHVGNQSHASAQAQLARDHESDKARAEELKAMRDEKAERLTASEDTKRAREAAKEASKQAAAAVAEEQEAVEAGRHETPPPGSTRGSVHGSSAVKEDAAADGAGTARSKASSQAKGAVKAPEEPPKLLLHELAADARAAVLGKMGGKEQQRAFLEMDQGLLIETIPLCKETVKACALLSLEMEARVDVIIALSELEQQKALKSLPKEDRKETTKAVQAEISPETASEGGGEGVDDAVPDGFHIMVRSLNRDPANPKKAHDYSLDMHTLEIAIKNLLQNAIVDPDENGSYEGFLADRLTPL